MKAKQYTEGFPETKSLLAACFHQDWGCDYEHWESVIDENFHNPVNNDLIVNELEILIRNFSEEQLQRFFYYVHTSIEPEREGYTYSGWLAAVLNRIKACNS
jgi:hypothetical protein